MKHSELLRKAKVKLSYGNDSRETFICLAIQKAAFWPWDMKKVPELQEWIHNMLAPWNTLRSFYINNNSPSEYYGSDVAMQVKRHEWLDEMIDYLEAQGK
jgi:hypothetical protein